MERLLLDIKLELILHFKLR